MFTGIVEEVGIVESPIRVAFGLRRRPCSKESVSEIQSQ